MFFFFSSFFSQSYSYIDHRFFSYLLLSEKSWWQNEKTRRRFIWVYLKFGFMNKKKKRKVRKNIFYFMPYLKFFISILLINSLKNSIIVYIWYLLIINLKKILKIKSIVYTFKNLKKLRLKHFSKNGLSNVKRSAKLL